MDVRGRPKTAEHFRAVPVAICSVSVGGMGLMVLDNRLTRVERGALIALNIGEGGLNMPGHIAWTRGGDEQATLLELGVQLMLLGTPPWTRMRYSAWVDEVVTASREPIRSW
jgi:hypothetical protein